MIMKRTLSFDSLEHKVVLSHAALTPVGAAPLVSPHHHVPGDFGGGNIDHSIPFIFATEVGGVAQNALNFTSNTYHGVLYGFEWKGISQIAAIYKHNGNFDQLIANVGQLSFRMPYGPMRLFPVWKADLEALRAGTLTPDNTGVPNFGAGNGAVADVLFHDLQTYLAAGLGTSFNILKSTVGWASDDLLTYNGTVAANGSHNTTITPPVVGHH
jgi:hypothetical protein